MKQKDLDCYRVNYDVDGWHKIVMDRGDFCVPFGAILAIKALCDELERRIQQGYTALNFKEELEVEEAIARSVDSVILALSYKKQRDRIMLMSEAIDAAIDMLRFPNMTSPESDFREIVQELGVKI